ncbi:hypothetical protein NGM10_10035 [Halorussus salilacus]|uniref:hypothetical protein n=1 Tax=Halorussus salilacus TaxID=2953750 RepID=UPI00209EE7F8|nr:hypothetical protein [Halorussus salilacus]USZ67069.1 hypothetical protein NGM10_10035 [Halorussus salilacus]
MYTSSDREERHSVEIPTLLLASLALALGAVAGLRLMTDAYSPPVWMLVEYGLTLALPATLMYGAYWLATEDFTTEELWRTLWWTVGGIVSLTSIAGFVLLHKHFEGTAIVEPIFLVAVLSLIGGVGGFATAVAQLHTTRVVDSSLESESADSAGTTEPADSSRSRKSDRERPAGRSRSDDDFGGPELLRSRTSERSLTRQWATLEAVAACGDCSLDELATMLAQDPRNSFPSDPERTTLQLYHRYLPALAETGLIEFDTATKFVRYAGPATLTG